MHERLIALGATSLLTKTPLETEKEESAGYATTIFIVAGIGKKRCDMSTCRCGNGDRTVSVKFEKFAPVSVCPDCAAEWERMKMYFWNQFVDPPKYRKPRGLNSAAMARMGLLDKRD
jgi:hypothetical protein